MIAQGAESVLWISAKRLILLTFSNSAEYEYNQVMSGWFITDSRPCRAAC
jgi:hypothetical protein